MNIEEKSFMRENKINEPILYIAIEPITKGDYDNTFKALKKIYEENPNFKIRTNSKVKQVIIAGTEEESIEMVVNRLIREFNIELKVSDTKIIYKSTIKKIVKVEGSFMRQ